MLDTQDNVNLIDILEDKLLEQPGISLHKNLVICDGAIKANLIVEMQSRKFVIEVVETE